jgi:hypothetical protein
MYLKIHEGSGSRVVAVCDEDLIGGVLWDKDIRMDLDKYRSFYVGQRTGADGVRKALSSFTSANIVGKESVGVALKMGLAGREDVMYIKQTPYIQIYKL